MLATSNFTRKALSQIITVYQGVLDIDLGEAGIKLTVKPNKDIDDMLDVINAELINVCEEYLADKHIGLDKYQLSTICAELTTLAMERCEEPFRVTVKTNRALIQEYLEKNKQKRETLERIKKENKELDKKIAKELEKKQRAPIEEPIVEEIPQEPVAKPTEKKSSSKKSKGYNGDPYSLATKFTF